MELMLVAAVGAIVFTAGALALRVVAANQRSVGAFQEVFLPADVGENFYPDSSLTAVDSYTAPNYGRCSQADTLRTLFLEEVEKSVAVFILPRGPHINTIRGRTINLYGRLPQSLDTPQAFLSFLLSNPDTATAAQVFSSYRGAPPASATTTVSTVAPDTRTTTTTSTATNNVTSTATNNVTSTATNNVTNASIFLLQPSGSNGQLWVRCVYEIDYVGLAANPNVATAPDVNSVFASVRRYGSNMLTHYYDIVYRDATTADVGIPCVHFERAERAVFAESEPARFKKAGNQPFYLVWWPDPGVQRLKGTAATAYTATSPQASYANHEGQTSYYFVVPQFPAL
jgi:hypothetical protein